MRSHSVLAMRLSRTSSLAALVALISLAVPLVGGCSGTNKNVLIGSWKFSSATGTMAGGCDATNVFTDKAWTFILQTGGAPVTAAVTYNVAPTQISVINAGTGGSGTYTIIDKDHVYTESAWGRCIYERTK